MRRSALVLVLPLVVLVLGCGGSGSSGGGGSSSSGNGGASHHAVSFAKCRQLVGGILFKAPHALPRIPKYTSAVASQCKRTPLRSTAFLQVYATAKVAKRRANGTSP